MKILINSGRVVPVFAKRDKLIAEMKARGHEVYVGGYQLEGREACETHDVGFVHIPFNRAGMNPLADLKTINTYRKVIREGGFDVVHGYTAKPNIYGSIAAAREGIKRVYPTINGLGYAFTGNSVRNRLVRFIICRLYKKAFGASEKVFFQNADDAEEMIRLKVLPREKCVVIAGSGIDLDAYPYSEMTDTKTFLFASRLLITKGLRDYVEAARVVKKAHPEARFLLAGALDPNPDGIRREELDSYTADGTVEYLGVVSDMPAALKECSVFVLPSYYREGVPHANLEAMSVGRAVLTTDSIGCRETVNGRNGFLVPPRSPEALAEKMIWMVENPDALKRMGIESRRYAEERFAVEKVNAVMLETMGL